MRNCEAIDEVLKRMSPTGRCAMPKESKPSSIRNEEPTKWPGEMPKRVLPERQPAVAMPSALDPIALMH